MEGGCLGYPGASTVASQPLDRILPPWLPNPRNPAMSPHSGTCHTDKTVERRKIRDGRGEDAKRTAPLHARWRTHCSEHCTKLPRTMWACTYGIDCWIPAELVGRLSTKLLNCLTAKLTNCLTAKFDDCLTAKLVNCLTAKLVVVNLVKLHLTKSNVILCLWLFLDE